MSKKVQKIAIHQFDPVIYPYKIWVIISRTPEIISEHFNEYNGDQIVFINGDVDRSLAFVMPVMKKDKSSYGAVIFFRSKKSMSFEVMAHESSHAAKYLFEHIGADIKEHEPFEYVIGWIASCCQKVKQNKL